MVFKPLERGGKSSPGSRNQDPSPSHLSYAMVCRMHLIMRYVRKVDSFVISERHAKNRMQNNQR
ncbi:hypothetical protein Mapa_005001 [Marchantia paleacea]|nr:hypothetical protein Mapa_005001 [Marchantia paleacea]